MCEFCDPDTNDSARAGAINTAEKLESLAGRYRFMAGARYKPHDGGAGAKAQQRNAVALIRRLVEDWL